MHMLVDLGTLTLASTFVYVLFIDSKADVVHGQQATSPTAALLMAKSAECRAPDCGEMCLSALFLSA